jgi:hypothetical protein
VDSDSISMPRAAIVAIPETAGSALYGMVDVLSVTGNVWQTLTRIAPTPPPFRVQVSVWIASGFPAATEFPSKCRVVLNIRMRRERKPCAT